MEKKKVVYGWSAAKHGKETGKEIEYRVTEFPTKTGGMMQQVEFFKPYVGSKYENGVVVNDQYGQPVKEWRKGFNFIVTERSLRMLVDRINHLVAAYFPAMGTLAFMQAQVPQQAQGFAPQQAPSPQPQYQQPAQIPPSMPPVTNMPPQPQYQQPVTRPPASQPVSFDDDEIPNF